MFANLIFIYVCMLFYFYIFFFFFFQAEDGIRDVAVTGVQTCALPIFHTGQDINAWGLSRVRHACAQRLQRPWPAALESRQTLSAFPRELLAFAFAQEARRTRRSTR